jgi:hypothetical protein
LGQQNIASAKEQRKLFNSFLGAKRMNLYRLVNQCSLAAILTLAAGDVFSCTLAPEAYDLEAFLKARSAVVFLGTVESLKESHTKAAVEQEIYFKTKHWWRGTPKNNVTAYGVTTKISASNCDGFFDFSVEAGEEWLIVANLLNGEILPSRLLSRKVKYGIVPADIIKLLEKTY